jgi:hypothetical protein
MKKIQYWSATNNRWLEVYAYEVEDKIVLLKKDDLQPVKVLGILDYNRKKAKGDIVEGWKSEE